VQGSNSEDNVELRLVHKVCFGNNVRKPELGLCVSAACSVVHLLRHGKPHVDRPFDVVVGVALARAEPWLKSPPRAPFLAVCKAVAMGMAGSVGTAGCFWFWFVRSATFDAGSCFRFRHTDSVGSRVAGNVDLITVGPNDQARDFAGFADCDNSIVRLRVAALAPVGLVRRRRWFVERTVREVGWGQLWCAETNKGKAAAEHVRVRHSRRDTAGGMGRKETGPLRSRLDFAD